MKKEFLLIKQAFDSLKSAGYIVAFKENQWLVFSDEEHKRRNEPVARHSSFVEAVFAALPENGKKLTVH